VPDYYDVISKPVDLTEIRGYIDNGTYTAVQQFLDDLTRLVFNSFDYNPVSTYKNEWTDFDSLKLLSVCGFVIKFSV